MKPCGKDSLTYVLVFLGGRSHRPVAWFSVAFLRHVRTERYAHRQMVHRLWASYRHMELLRPKHLMYNYHRRHPPDWQ